MSISLQRKVLYTALTTTLFLLLLEVLLAVAPWAWLSARAPVPDLPVTDGSVILCVGDSVTAGVGVPVGQSWSEHLGLSMRRHQVPVLREAVPGAGVDFAAGAPLDALAGLGDGVAPTVLVMLGHNDMVRWAPGARSQFNRLRNQGGALGGEAARWQGPRLLRAARWVWLAASRSAPAVAQVEEGALAGRMVATYAPLRDAAAARGGRLVLLTYLVPGAPPEGLDPSVAEIVSASRGAQRSVNRAIRTAGGELGVDVFDLERSVDTGEVWSLSAFVDHIHPTAESSARAAAVLYEHMRP